MKINASPLGARLDLRLAAYTAAGAAAAIAAAPGTQAAVVYSGPVSIAVPATLSGVYLNFVTGASSTSSITGYDFNPYASSTLLNFFTSAAPNGMLDTGTVVRRLSGGESIGSTGTYSAGVSSGTPLQTGGYGYVGVKFLNESTSTYDYAWVLMSTTASTGFPATIIGYAYENTGAAILAGQIGGGAVPEPGTVAALGLGALSLGAAGVRRWRKGRQAA